MESNYHFSPLLLLHNLGENTGDVMNIHLPDALYMESNYHFSPLLLLHNLGENTGDVMNIHLPDALSCRSNRVEVRGCHG
jgi:predicted esterase